MQLKVESIIFAILGWTKNRMITTVDIKEFFISKKFLLIPECTSQYIVEAPMIIKGNKAKNISF